MNRIHFLLAVAFLVLVVQMFYAAGNRGYQKLEQSAAWDFGPSEKRFQASSDYPRSVAF